MENEITEKVEKKSRNWAKTIASNLLYLVLILVGVYLINTYVMVRTAVIGPSMSPALEADDFLIVDKLTYQFRDPRRFEVIVFRYMDDATQEQRHYIKRIIGLPGETVQIIEGVVYIDGRPLDEQYGAETIRQARRAAEEILLGEDEYFVLGDNRNMSSDSRDANVGNVQKSKIVGRTFLRIWPLSRFGLLQHE